MLVHVQKIKTQQECKDLLQFKPNTTYEEAFPLCKRNLCFCMQMLQKNEFSTILSTGNCVINIKNVQGNQFAVEFNTRMAKHILSCSPHQNITPELQSSSLPALLRYLHNQILPQYKQCVLVSGRMQEIFGFITHKTSDSCVLARRMDDNFLLDNATSISKLTDMLNCNLQTQLPNGMPCYNPAPETHQIFNHGKKPVISAAYAALQLKLAAIFCATARNDISCMWHVSQNMMSDMSSEMLKTLYAKPPEKNCVTLLLRGDTIDERIYRINLCVRFFPVNHEFTTRIMPTAMALNASNSKTGLLVLTGVKNNIAAAIYHNSDTQTMLQNKISFAAYMGSL